MKHIPSLKKLREAFGKKLYNPRGLLTILDIENEKKSVERDIRSLRRFLVRWRDDELKTQDLLEALNVYLQGHGVEYLHSENDRARAYYINMGDTYDTTLVLDVPRRRVWITSWGNWVETEERQGNRFA